MCRAYNDFNPRSVSNSSLKDLKRSLDELQIKVNNLKEVIKKSNEKTIKLIETINELTNELQKYD